MDAAVLIIRSDASPRENYCYMGSAIEQRDDCFKEEDRDELKRHTWQLDDIGKKLDEIKLTAKETATDARGEYAQLESRIRALENFKWIAWGIGSIAAVFGGWLIQLWASAHK
jgi:hypothetical protein